MTEEKVQRKKIYLHLVLIAFLFIALVITTFALVSSTVSVQDNVFQTDRVAINLNNGKTIFNGEDMNIEPGYSVKEDFTIQNLSGVDAYYRIYLENIEEDLADSLIFEIYSGDELVFSIPMASFTRDNMYVSEDPLPGYATRTLTAVVRMDENSGNSFQGKGVTFDITADAVQVRNNPDQDFE